MSLLHLCHHYFLVTAHRQVTHEASHGSDTAGNDRLVCPSGCRPRITIRTKRAARYHCGARTIIATSAQAKRLINGDQIADGQAQVPGSIARAESLLRDITKLSVFVNARDSRSRNSYRPRRSTGGLKGRAEDGIINEKEESANEIWVATCHDSSPQRQLNANYSSKHVTGRWI